jgi:hypothetical protein
MDYPLSFFDNAFIIPPSYNSEKFIFWYYIRMKEDDQDQLPCSDKLSFDSKLQADATANIVSYRYGSSVYPYVCNDCGLWHLSSTKST